MDASILAYTRQRSLFNRLEITSNNVANENTTGFKKDVAFYINSTDTIDGKRDPAPKMLISTDLQSGEYTATGRNLDIAIKGRGFIAVDTPLGPRYTRAGSLTVNNEGNLSTSQGYAITGDGGPIAILPDDRNVEIAENGAVFALSADNVLEQRGQITPVNFADVTGLRKTGDGFFISEEDPEPGLFPADYKIASGVLETSNVKPVEQINELIEINRSVADTARIIKDQHDLMRDSFSRLSRIDQ